MWRPTVRFISIHFMRLRRRCCELKLIHHRYYNNCLFFNIQKDFVAQTGDPTGTGNGGTSFDGFFAEELARRKAAAAAGKSNKSPVAAKPTTFKDEIRPALSLIHI